MARRTRSRRPLAADLSPEIEWYLTERGYEIPEIVPRVRTPEPRTVKGAVFDPAAVDRKIAALRHLRHTKGKWAGRPIEPTAVQVAYIIAPVFGWLRPNSDGRMVRIIRDVYVEMPRKSAKTTLVSGLAMLMGFADGEAGAEVILGAAGKDQARKAFTPLAQVAKQSKVLTDAGIRALRGEIVQDATGSTVTAVSSRGDLAHGANVHCGLVDELHVHKSPDLLEAIETGTGAREQPLVFIITTADAGETASVYAQRREMVEKVAKRTLKNPTLYGVVFAADDHDDPFAESTWIKANPLYPETPSREYMQSAAARAMADNAAKASFMRLHCGIRSRLSEAFIDLAKWDANRGIVDEAALRGKLAVGGLDLAAVSDITALSWIFPDGGGGYDVLWRFWLPEAALDRLDARTARTASGWVQDGWLTLTPGDVTDYNFIKTKIIADMDVFDIAALGADPWNATQLLNDLQEESVPVETVRQGVISLSAPMKELDRLIRAGTARKPLLRHGGNPVARWMADNLRAHVDSNDNIKPDKAKSMDKIDGMSALITALHVALNSDVAESAYEDHGLITI